MKIGLIDVDSHNFPNLALMKISSYHKNKKDNVEWYEPFSGLEKEYDIVYMSKIFTFTNDYVYPLYSKKVIKGGTGYDITSKLDEEIENIIDLDYSLYPNCDYSIQFLSRGCIRKCSFCVVPQKEGLIHQVRPLNLNPNGKYIKLLDNNFFACKEWKNNIEILKQFNQPIEFNQGIDLRIFNDEMGQALATLKIKDVKIAWDNYQDKDLILNKLELLLKYVKPYKITCYCLVGFENKEIVDTDLERVLTLKEYKVNPFVMGYINFDDPNYEKSKSVRDFCRWVNMKAIFKSVAWEDYKR